jgi:hypothetical protein
MPRRSEAQYELRQERGRASIWPAAEGASPVLRMESLLGQERPYRTHGTAVGSNVAPGWRLDIGARLSDIGQCLAKDYVDVPLRPAFELGHALEASPLIHPGRLEVIARHPDAQHAPPKRLNDHRVEERATVAPASIGLVDPHLLDLGHATPSIPGNDADRPAGIVADHEADALAVVATGGCAIILAEAILHCVEFDRRRS